MLWGVDMSLDDAIEIVESYDTNKDKRISFEEFKRASLKPTAKMLTLTGVSAASLCS